MDTPLNKQLTECAPHSAAASLSDEAEQELARKNDLLEILIDLSSRYINCSLDSIEGEIEASLEKVGRFVDVDRVYIFEYDHRKRTTSNTFEWCNTSIASQIEFLKNFPIDGAPDWMEAHKQGRIISIPDVSALDGEASVMKVTLEAQGIKSLVTIPMIYKDTCLGFVGFDTVKQHHVFTDSEITLLKFYTQIMANIHLRNIHEQEMREARIRLEKANEVKNHFIAKTSHELRNPLNGAYGFLLLLKELVPVGAAKEYLANSTQSLSTAIRLLNDLLDISSIEVSGFRLEKEPVDVARLISESIILCRREADGDSRVRFDIRIGSNIPNNLVSDFGRLKQIIGNLVLNAVTHAQATKVTVTCTPAGQTQDAILLLFSVKDNGIGMSEETLAHAFDLFYKQDRNSPGSGLGLPICREFVTLMGGELWVESIEHAGSECFFIIPFHLDTPCQAAPAGDISIVGVRSKPGGRSVSAVETPPDLSGLRILLAEDNAINRALVVEMLRPRGVHVTAVQNGAQALEALQAEAFDLILMDIQMPVMDGLEALNRIRDARNPIPVIVLTGSVLPQEKENYMKRGANGVVEKPIFIDVLLEVIGAAVSAFRADSTRPVE
jgi:signal transduction histidine kinase/ActR/RegA family two-component response regulator